MVQRVLLGVKNQESRIKNQDIFSAASFQLVALTLVTISKSIHSLRANFELYLYWPYE
jgi:hypothetical protein